MTETIDKLESLLKLGSAHISKSTELDLTQKTNPSKWSKKEILGHLIDSGINNLQRFTEIQFEDKPYKYRPYKQAELVNANNYQQGDTKELIQFWLSINQRIKTLMTHQTRETLDYKIEFDIDNISDLRFLMTDYVEHIEHHLDQIMK